MFRARFEDDLPTLESLSGVFHAQGNLSASLLTFDQLFSHDFHLHLADIPEVASFLRSFWDYARVLQRFTCHPNPCNDTALQKLFSFESVSEDIYRVSQHGHLFSRCSAKKASDIKQTEDGRLLVPRWTLEDAIKTTLAERLHERVIHQNQRCRDLCFLTSSVTATSIDDNAFEATQELDFIPEDPEEALAASKIASAYRKYALRKLAEKDTVTEMRRRVLARFEVTSKTIPWKNPTYRLLFRRAAPHLLHAAECLRDHLQGEIHIAKANLRNMQRSNHQELDNIQAAFHDVSYVQQHLGMSTGS